MERYLYTVQFTRFGVVQFNYLHESDGVLYEELKRLVEKPGLKVAKAYKVDGYYHIEAGYYAFKPFTICG